MANNIHQPKTLQQAIRYFSNEEVCIQFVARLRWPDGNPECPICGHREHYYLATQKRWKCKRCWKQFSVKVGTIFEDSPISLTKWLPALWMLINCKNGISSYELGRALGVSQKSTWFMLHRLRLVLQARSGILKLGGFGKEVEADESFIGGAARFMHPRRRARMITARGVKDKATAFGILERGGEIRAFAVPSRRKRALQTEIVKHVEPGTPVYTDALMSYVGLNEQFKHEVIDHARQYVRGRVHTNCLENFWSLLKRGIKGTYISVEPFHLFRYLDEQAWRYNNRAVPKKGITTNDGDRFIRALSQVAGKRLTFAEVTGKDGKKALN